MAQAGVKIAIASEGTFAPHLQIGILPAAIELMVLVDDERGAVIRESFVSLATNFDRITVTPADDLTAFLARVKFPSHGVVVRPNVGIGAASIWKGLVTNKAVAEAVERAALLSADGAVVVETDMRAHVNPTRMASLGILARRLAARVEHLCAHCGAPGYDVVERKAGLACLDCGTPTSLVACEVLRCDTCGAGEVRAAPHGLPGAAPMHCPSCNP